MSANALSELCSLAGRRALVTGSAGGIGRAVVGLLMEAGAEVLGVDRESGDSPCETIGADLGDSAATRALAAELGRREPPFDVFVHCAGVTRDAVLWKMPPQDFSQVIEVNLVSAFTLLQHLVPGMRRLGDGRIVLIASINGERGKLGQSNYAASKAGLIGLAKTAAREVGRFGIRVNVVSPGLIETTMTAQLPEDVRRAAIEETVLGRAGKPDDVARAVLFLCSNLSGHITGQVLRVDGGQYL